MWSDGGRTYADRLFLQSARGVCCSSASVSGGMLIYEKLFTIYRGSCLFYLQQVEGNDMMVDNKGLRTFERKSCLIAAKPISCKFKTFDILSASGPNVLGPATG